MIDFLTDQYHMLDITTAVLGLLYIILELRVSVWMWVVGFVMQVLGIILYYQKGLYADCGMELYYLSMTVYGYTRWRTAPDYMEDYVKKRKSHSDGIQSAFNSDDVSKNTLIFIGVIFAVLWGAIYYVLITYTNSTVPLADSFTTALSVIGIWALAHKFLEQWFIWIVVDIVTSVLYFYKDIPFKASLYALYVIIAIFGYFNWRKKLAQQVEDKPKPTNYQDFLNRHNDNYKS